MDNVALLRIILTVFGATALVLSLSIELLTARQAKREAVETLRRAVDTNEAAVRAALNAELAAKNAAEAATDAAVAAETAKETSENTKSAVNVLSTLVADVKKVQEEILRTSKEIDRVRVEMEFRLPMTVSELAAYKARLDAGLLEFGSTAKSWEERDKLKASIAYSGMSTDAGGSIMRGNVWLNARSPLFPSKNDGNNVYQALVPWEFELAFYKKPIDPQQFEVSALGVISTAPIVRKLIPDLVIAQLFDVIRPFVIWSRVPPVDDGYRLEMLQWIPPKTSWKSNTVDIQFIQDLAGVQLFIDMGGFGPQRADTRSRFEITRIVMLVNNSRVAIEPTQLTKHLSANGHPFWEFRFPTNSKAMFTANPAPRAAGRLRD